AQVIGARLFYRRAGDEAFTVAPGARTLRSLLPALAAREGVDYYLEVLDRYDNVIALVGSARAPLRVEAGPPAAAPAPPAVAPAAPPATRPLPAPPAAPTQAVHAPEAHVVARWLTGAGGLAALRAALGVDV